MPLPALLPAVLGFAKSAGGRQAISAVTSALGGGGLGPGRRRRRRTRLTATEKANVMFLAQAIGKTAAANYINLLK